jgi:PAS domain S-box-containing protein
MRERNDRTRKTGSSDQAGSPHDSDADPAKSMDARAGTVHQSNSVSTSAGPDAIALPSPPDHGGGSHPAVGAPRGSRNGSKLRQAEGALRASELLYRSVVDNLANGVVVQDAAGRIVASNPAAREILGLTVDQLTGRTSFDPRWQAVWADGTPAKGVDHPATIARTTGRAVTDVVMGVRHSSGVTRWLQVSARPLRETSEDPISGVVVSFLDTTERRRIDQALRDTEALLDQTQALTKVGGWAYDVAANRVIWTDEVYRIHELPRDYDPNSAERDIEFYAPVDRARIAEAFRLSFEEGRPYDLELRLITAKGREIWVRSVGQPQVEDGHVAHVYGTIADITEQRRTDEELRVAHARLRRFIDADMLGVMIGNAGGAIVEANDYYLDLIGYTRAQLEAGEIDWRAITPTEWRPGRSRAATPSG